MYFHGSWSWYWLLTPVRLHYDIKYFCVKRWNIFCHLAQNWVCGLLSGDTWPRHCRDEEEDVPILLIIKVKTSSDQICWADDRPQWWDSNFQRPIISDQWKNKSAVKKVFGIICMIRSLKSILFLRKIWKGKQRK